ncbi:hypothetical protein D3C86_1545470 [compost metagenome]
MLSAPADLDRRPEAGRFAQGQRHPPDGRRLGLGRLPRRGRHGARHPRQDQQLHAPPCEHHHEPGQGGEQLHQLHPGQHRSPGRRLRRSPAAGRGRFRLRRFGREHFHHQGRRGLHARSVGRRAQRHHAQHRVPHLPGPGPRSAAAPHHARRGLHQRRSLLHRHRRRSHADPRTRPHRHRRGQPWPDHAKDSGGLL